MRLLSSSAFLSGCVPIALINLILNYDSTDFALVWFAVAFLLISVVAGVYFWIRLKSFYSKNNEPATIVNIKRKDIFASGAISYYVLPFISFVSEGRDGIIILVVLILLFLQIFTNNRMFLYTPLIDILRYQVLECEIIISGKVVKANILTKDGSGLYFNGENEMRIFKIEQDIYFAQMKEV